MNRAQRREFQRQVRRKAGPDSVTLRGGPMDNWIVKPDAPALQPDWRAKYLEEAARGDFEQAEIEKPADDRREWDALDDVEKAPWRDESRRNRGDGRYVMLNNTPLPEAKWETL